jgi:hypothetical protein
MGGTYGMQRKTRNAHKNVWSEHLTKRDHFRDQSKDKKVHNIKWILEK